MRNAMLGVGLMFILAMSAFSDVVARPTFVPPVQSKSALDAVLHPIPQGVVQGYLDRLVGTHVYDVFAGENERLKSLFSGSSSKGLKVATGYNVHLQGQDFFTTHFAEGSGYVHMGAVKSVDALALRVVVDLSGLASGEEAWLIDPTAPRAFGPYTASDHLEGGRWLPTVEGDTAVLIVRSEAAESPQLAIVAISHFYIGFGDPDVAKAANALSCNINIACETDPTVQSVSTAAALLVVPDNGVDNALGSGTLISNPDTPEDEPYLLTAHHVVGTQQMAERIDVVWDFRASGCGTNDPPSLASLPRSNGQTLLTASDSVDMTLLELDNVPSGTFGRMYAGYSTQDVSVGKQVICIHHPQGTHMRISYGAVQATGVTGSLGLNQIQVLWGQGVTEFGSSGSGLFVVDGPYLLVGCLSSGLLQQCQDTSNNIDNFASFKDFYPQAQHWLGGTATTSGCPAQSAFKNAPEVLAQLRAFRDKGLLQFAWGTPIVDAYYKAAPYLARIVEQSGTARRAFVAIATPFAEMGRLLEGNKQGGPRS